MIELTDFPKLGIKTDELLATVRCAIDAARQEQDDFGAVNWGDLGVVDVEYRLSVMHPADGPWCVVLVEEAAPECGLAQYLTQQVQSAGFDRVIVECEW